MPYTPSGHTGLLSALVKAGGTAIRDRYYKGQEVHLDGYSFTNCCFHNCTLVSVTGVFALENCTVAGCTVLFGEHAIRLIRLYNVVSPTAGYHPLFHPDRAPDGAITIK